MSIWNVAAVVQGGACVIRVEAKTQPGAEKLFRRMVSEQGVADSDVIVGFVALESTEDQVMAALVEKETDAEKVEMTARVRKATELLSKLTNSVMEAEYAGADVRLLLTALEEAQSLLTNAADAVERGETER